MQNLSQSEIQEPWRYPRRGEYGPQEKKLF